MTTSPQDKWFPKRWPAENPDILQLYSMATPNGQKVSIMLEEIGLPYEPHLINIMKDDQFDEDFVKINPNSKIPAILDPNGPNDEPMLMMESGAILLYLAEKSGKLLATDPKERWETIQWLFFQMASVGPMFGQFGHFFKFAAGKTDDYGKNRYTAETQRLLRVLDKRLSDRDFIMTSGYSVADIAIAPWVKGLEFYEGLEHLGFANFTHVVDWLNRVLDRPAVEKGRQVCTVS